MPNEKPPKAISPTPQQIVLSTIIYCRDEEGLYPAPRQRVAEFCSIATV